MNKSNKYDLSIIIVSYNTKKLLQECLRSLIPSDRELSMEVIVVDNCSVDKSVEAARKFSNKLNLKVIENNENKGFGAANNQGMKAAKGDYILLLNSDTIANKNAVVSTIDYMGNNEDVGVLGCKLVEADEKVQSNGGYFPSLINVFFWMTFLDDIKLFYKLIKPYHINPNFQKDDIRIQDWVTGAYFLIKKDVYEKVGGFDEDYFMYVEEMDYCYRIKKHGWKTVYYPKSYIIHLGGGSGTSENAIIQEFEGLVLFYKKHKGNLGLLRLLLKMGIFLRILVFLLLGNHDRSKIYAKAWNYI